MRDLVFLALVLGFFVVAALFVAGCDSSSSRQPLSEEEHGS